MKTALNHSFSNRPNSLVLGAARLHARIVGRLTSAGPRFSSPSGSSAISAGSPWTSIRLDLMKSPLTRLHE